MHRPRTSPNGTSRSACTLSASPGTPRSRSDRLTCTHSRRRTSQDSSSSTAGRRNCPSSDHRTPAPSTERSHRSPRTPPACPRTLPLRRHPPSCTHPRRCTPCRRPPASAPGSHPAKRNIPQHGNYPPCSSSVCLPCKYPSGTSLPSCTHHRRRTSHHSPSASASDSQPPDRRAQPYGIDPPCRSPQRRACMCRLDSYPPSCRHSRPRSSSRLAASGSNIPSPDRTFPPCGTGRSPCTPPPSPCTPLPGTCRSSYTHSRRRTAHRSAAYAHTPRKIHRHQGRTDPACMGCGHCTSSPPSLPYTSPPQFHHLPQQQIRHPR